MLAACDMVWPFPHFIVIAIFPYALCVCGLPVCVPRSLSWSKSRVPLPKTYQWVQPFRIFTLLWLSVCESNVDRFRTLLNFSMNFLYHLISLLFLQADRNNCRCNECNSICFIDIIRCYHSNFLDWFRFGGIIFGIVLWIINCNIKSSHANGDLLCILGEYDKWFICHGWCFLWSPLVSTAYEDAETIRFTDFTIAAWISPNRPWNNRVFITDIRCGKYYFKHRATEGVFKEIFFIDKSSCILLLPFDKKVGLNGTSTNYSIVIY